MKTLISILIIIFAIVYGLYFYNFPSGFAEKQDVWGQFGDFVGGTLNPILSFITIYILYRTIILQQESLEKTSAALTLSQNTYELSRTELSKSSEILVTQNKLIQLQKFEGAFFELTKLTIEAINTSSYTFEKTEYKGSSGLDGLIFDLFKKISDKKNTNWIEDFFDENENFFSLLKLTSGIFSFVNRSSLSPEEKNSYLSLLTSILPSGSITAICFVKIFTDWPLSSHFVESGFFELPGISDTFKACSLLEEYKSN
ncbi:hypothetical protein HX891_00620 [Pseudomonas reactans]|uniref:hypothetical protein n=1 Tax=Pseudomonas reactans TaxID=117680 RepID=UPI0015BFAA15|nr:hypothetical protein [Pseudomonas reactans]NWD78863.1 hypothetical protein [Pseudomonas reactans]